MVSFAAVVETAEDGRATVAVNGDLNALTALLMLAAVTDAIDQHASSLVIDLRGVGCVEPCAVEALAGLPDLIAPVGVNVDLIGAPDSLDELVGGDAPLPLAV